MALPPRLARRQFPSSAESPRPGPPRAPDSAPPFLPLGPSGSDRAVPVRRASQGRAGTWDRSPLPWHPENPLPRPQPPASTAKPAPLKTHSTAQAPRTTRGPRSWKGSGRCPRGTFYPLVLLLVGTVTLTSGALRNALREARGVTQRPHRQRLGDTGPRFLAETRFAWGGGAVLTHLGSLSSTVFSSSQMSFTRPLWMLL